MKRKTQNKPVFFVKDEDGTTWSIAPTKLDARINIAWFLPRGNKYYIEPTIISKDSNETD